MIDLAASFPGALADWKPEGSRGEGMHPLTLVYRFVLHTVAGVFLFSVIGGVAVLLNYATLQIERAGVSPNVMLAIRGLEAFLFIIDFLCIVVFVSAETWEFLRDVLKRVTGGRDE